MYLCVCMYIYIYVYKHLHLIYLSPSLSPLPRSSPLSLYLSLSVSLSLFPSCFLPSVFLSFSLSVFLSFCLSLSLYLSISLSLSISLASLPLCPFLQPRPLSFSSSTTARNYLRLDPPPFVLGSVWTLAFTHAFLHIALTHIDDSGLLQNVKALKSDTPDRAHPGLWLELFEVLFALLAPLSRQATGSHSIVAPGCEIVFCDPVLDLRLILVKAKKRETPKMRLPILCAPGSP